MQRDEAYLLDILIAARKALQFLEGMTWEAFVKSELHQNAVMHPLEIIGEAARRVSQETRDAHPEIPFPALAVRGRTRASPDGVVAELPPATRVSLRASYL